MNRSPDFLPLCDIREVYRIPNDVGAVDPFYKDYSPIRLPHYYSNIILLNFFRSSSLFFTR